MADGLLLLHAWPVDARMWEPQVAELGPRATTLAPHLPGFGPGRPAGPAPEVITMSIAAEHVERALDAGGVGRALVCGLSIGGYVAFELWRRARERVLGLVLANTRAAADTTERAEARRALARRLRDEGNVLVDEPPPLVSAEASPELRERVRAMIADQSPEAVAAAALGMAERPDSTPDLAGIDVPTLVITSTGDTLVPPEASAEMAADIPGARLEVLEGAGHLSNLEAPEAFNRLLLEHVASIGLI